MSYELLNAGRADGLARLLGFLEGQFAAILRASGVPEEDREDLLQDVLLAFILKQDSVARPERWLPQALRIRCARYWQARLVRRRVEATMTRHGVAPQSAQVEERLNIRVDVKRSLDRLPKRTRAVLELRFGRGLSDEEVAAQTGLARSSIDNTARRGLALARKRLGGRGYRAA